MSTTEAQLVQVFSSFQGEGLYVGARQLFIRFAGCNMTCQYCDTPEALVLPKSFKIEATPGKRDFEEKLNPVPTRELFEIVERFTKNKNTHHSICLTGGEPLLQVDFLKHFLPEQGRQGHKIYLETNGVLPKHLEEIIDLVDIIAFDIKLPSATGLSSYLEEHKKALEVASLKEVFVKIVVTRDTKPKEIDDAVDVIAQISPDIPLVIQPVTPYGSIKHRPLPESLFTFYNFAIRKLKNVRIIPQMHKLMGQL
ncbi:MAG: 7-carboxy-7-deazaguanine synthase QueE [Candidatus Saganbacteria bacterium]|nr:7-carboxy-7-deazaguanine synthase QueE [Candidatus Saganbacteria bacterium]